MTDERTRPAITRGCRLCGVTDEEIRSGYVVVSPSGLAHHGADYGWTACGHDATGDEWWWPA